MKLQKPKGTQDILPSESAKWQYVEAVARETFKNITTVKFVHQCSNIMKLSVVQSVIQLIS